MWTGFSRNQELQGSRPRYPELVASIRRNLDRLIFVNVRPQASRGSFHQTRCLGQVQEAGVQAASRDLESSLERLRQIRFKVHRVKARLLNRGPRHGRANISCCTFSQQFLEIGYWSRGEFGCNQARSHFFAFHFTALCTPSRATAALLSSTTESIFP